MKKWIYKLVHPVLLAYWYLFRPRTFGVKVVVLSGDNIVLIRNTYGSKLWTLPGGGVHGGETPENAAVREVREELGVPLEVNELVKLGEIESSAEYKLDTIYVYLARLDKGLVLEPDAGEIAESGWFGCFSLPTGVHQMAKKIIEMLDAYLGHN